MGNCEISSIFLYYLLKSVWFLNILSIYLCIRIKVYCIRCNQNWIFKITISCILLLIYFIVKIIHLFTSLGCKLDISELWSSQTSRKCEREYSAYTSNHKCWLESFAFSQVSHTCICHFRGIIIFYYTEVRFYMKVFDFS